MSFGFSVGDFVAVGKLIGEITTSLQAIGGAKSEYQELIREFQSLDAALRHLDRLDSDTPGSRDTTSIKYAALSCRHPLEEFLVKVKRFESSLGLQHRSNGVKKATDKLRWTFGYSEDIKRLQTYLNIHIGTINVLLAEHGLEKMNLNARKAEVNAQEVRDQLENTHNMLEKIKDSMSAQAMLLRGVHSMLGGLYKLVCGEMKISLQYFSLAINKVCVSTQQIYSVVLEIRESVAVVDTRWTHFQAPYIVEDALGFKFPVPSEYDFGMLDNILRYRFREGPGASNVRRGNYELCKANNRSQVITSASRMIPGGAFTMAVIVSKTIISGALCPMPRCGSTEALPYLGGGFTCCVCEVWFDQATGERQRTEELLDATSTGAPGRQPGENNVEESDDDDQSTALRNVKWTDDADEEKFQEGSDSSTYDTESSIFDRVDTFDGMSLNPSGTPQPWKHALQDYQLQLMLLEQQNKKRLLDARKEQDEQVDVGAQQGPKITSPRNKFDEQTTKGTVNSRMVPRLPLSRILE